MSSATPSNCRICNDRLEKQSAVSFYCSHQLCPICAQVTEGRSFCPTCLPSAPPVNAVPSNSHLDTVPSSSHTDLFSNNTEQAPPKNSPTSKTIAFDPLSRGKVSPSTSRLVVPSSSCHSSGCSSSSSSPAPHRKVGLTSGRPSSDSCIVAQIDYAESPPPPSVRCQASQQQQHPGTAARPLGHHRLGPETGFGDGIRGCGGSVRRNLEDCLRTVSEHCAAYEDRQNQTAINELVFVEKICAVEREVRRLANDRRRAIDRAEMELLMKLEAKRMEMLKESEAARKDVEMCIERLNTLKRTIESSLEGRVMGDEGTLERVRSEVQGDVRRVLEYRLGTVCFGGMSFMYTAEHVLDEGQMNILGEIEFLPNKERADDRLMFLSSPLPLIHALADPSSSSAGQSIVGLALLADRIYVIRTNSHDVEVYDARSFTPFPPLSLLRLLTPMLVPSVSDLSSCPTSQTLYMADTTNSNIYRIDTEGRLLTHWKLPVNFTGLSVTQMGTVLVGTSCGRIIEFDQSGKTHRTLGRSALRRIRSAGGSVAIDSPRHFVRRANGGGIIACDFSSAHGGSSVHVVYELDERGQIQRYFGADLADLNEPCCLATGPLDHVIVADRVNRKVRLLDAGLRFVRNLLDEKQLGGEGGEPNRLVLDEATGRLFIGLRDGRILIYRTIF